MKIRVFRSDKGDCLLLRTTRGRTLLVDGGMPQSFEEWVKPALEKLSPPRLDVVCVSHIDQDHIGGVLRLFQWRAKGSGAPGVGELWHNGFSPVKQGRGALGILRKAAGVLSAGKSKHRKLGAESERVALSIREAEELSRRAQVPINRPARGALMKVPLKGKGKPIRLDDLTLRVIGPFAEDLRALKNDWEKWLATNKATLRKLDRLVGLGGPSAKASALYDELEVLTEGLALGRGRFGDRSQVTVPNLASLMLLVESRSRSLLLTGDGHADDVLRGLERVGALEPGGKLHVDVLKVQHHASRYNVTDEFCARVTANHYLFCGNGKHQNPHLESVEKLADGRALARRTAFTFHFNSSATASDAAKPHMNKLQELARKLEKRHEALTTRFLAASAASFEL